MKPTHHHIRFAGTTLKAASAALTITVVLVLGVVATPSARAGTFGILHAFTGSPDGANPYANLIQDTAGNLYGTTESGGASGAGTVFEISSTGTETILYSFTGGSDGSNPFAALVQDTAGNLYGTTAFGGSGGLGTVFKLSTTGKETVLHNFQGGTDGCYPFGSLIRDAAGNLYGTTEDCGASDFGTVFKLAKGGKETILHSFAGPPLDGEFPNFTSLLMDAKGNLYGVTEQGGSGACGGVGCGTLYKLSKSRKLTVLYAFHGGPKDGCDVFGTPAIDSKGNFYGTANACGATGAGIVWKVTKKGVETVLHNFSSQATDGQEPIAGVILDAKGNLYGTTYQGGPRNLGTVYKLSKKGKLTLLQTFTGTNGSYLYAGLLQDASGNLYGTTLYGGTGDECTNNCGTVYKITK